MKDSKIGGTCGMQRKDQKCIQNIGRKTPLRRPRCSWEDNIKMDLKEIGCEGVDYTPLAQDRNQRRAIVNTVMNLRVT
jgi:hypothetical protein